MWDGMGLVFAGQDLKLGLNIGTALAWYTVGKGAEQVG